MENERYATIIERDSDVERDVHVEVYNNFEVLQPIQQEWDDFVEKNGGDIFLTYDWCRVWWKYYGENRDLALFVFRNNKSLVGIVPLFFERIWLGPVFLNVAKIVGADFGLTAVSLSLASDFQEEIVRGLSDKLQGYSWDILLIGPLAGLYVNIEQFVGVCRRCLGKSCRIRVSQSGVQTYVQLADSWEKQLGHLSKNQRRTIKRSYKDISRTASEKGLSLASNIASNENFEEMFNGFVQMHQSHWKNIGEQGHFDDWPDALEFHREVAAAQLKRNRLRLLEVKLGERWLGYEYDYRFANRYYAILNARGSVDELPGISPTVSIGSILYAEQAKNAIKENVRCIDMMRGGDNYKQRLGGKLHPVRNLFVCRRRPLVLVRVSLFRAFAWLLNVCYYKIWFRRIAPRLPIHRGLLWRKWIKSKPLV